MFFGHGEKVRQASQGIFSPRECSTDRLQQELCDNSEYSQLLTHAALFARRFVSGHTDLWLQMRGSISQQLLHILISSSLEKRAKEGKNDRMLFTLSAANHIVSELLQHELKMDKYGQDEVKYFCRISAVELNTDRTIARVYVPTVSKKTQTFFHEWDEYQQVVAEQPEKFAKGKNGCEFVYIVAQDQKEKCEEAIQDKLGNIPENVVIEEAPVSIPQLGELSEAFLRKIGVSQQGKGKLSKQGPSVAGQVAEQRKVGLYDPVPFLRREVSSDLRLPIVGVPLSDPQAKLAQYWNKHAVEWPLRAIDPKEMLWVIGRTSEYLVGLYEQLVAMQKYCGNDLLGTNYAVLKGKVNEFIMHAVYEMTHMDSAILTEDETRQMSFVFSPNARRNIDEFGEKYTPGISRPDFLALKLIGNEPRIVTVVETTTHPNISIARLAAKIFATGNTAYQYPNVHTEGHSAHLTILVPKNEAYTRHLQQQLSTLHNRGAGRFGIAQDAITQTYSFLITQDCLVGEAPRSQRYKPVEVTILPVNITTEEIDKFAVDFYKSYRPPLQNGQKGCTLQELAASL